MPRIEEAHIVLIGLDVIGPASRLDECATPSIAKLVDRVYQLPKMHSSIRIFF